MIEEHIFIISPAPRETLGPLALLGYISTSKCDIGPRRNSSSASLSFVFSVPLFSDPAAYGVLSHCSRAGRVG